MQNPDSEHKLDGFLREFAPSLEVPSDLRLKLRERITAAASSRSEEMSTLWDWLLPKFAVRAVGALVGALVLTYGFSVGRSLSEHAESKQRRVELEILRQLNSAPYEQSMNPTGAQQGHGL